MFKTCLAAAAVSLSLVIAPAVVAQDGNGTIKMESAHDAATTLDRLAAIFKAKGITVFARVDHAAGAKKIGEDMAPTQLLLFGNPLKALKIRTPASCVCPLSSSNFFASFKIFATKFFCFLYSRSIRGFISLNF